MGKNPGKTPKEQSSYQLRDVVLAKIRGFPPWPGMVVDPESAPQNVQKERPSSKKTTFYCVRFFPVGDYAWLVSKDISKLQTHEIESYISEPYKRSGDLLQGYRIALDPKKWEEEREAASQDVVEEEANAEVDQLDSENEDGEPKKPSKSKKRKRESEIPTTGKSKSKSKPKKDSAEPASKKKITGKGKKNGTKSKELVESEDDGDQEAEAEDDDSGPSKKTSPPPTKKAKRDKDGDDELDSNLTQDPEAMKVREWRHKLQKTFLSNKAALPKEDDMPALDQLFTTVEQYDKINIQYLSFSKIGKVMRHIALLPAEKVPRDAEFRFRDRAKALVDKWHQILHENKPNGAEANGTNKSDGETDNPDAVNDAAAAPDANGRADDDIPVTSAPETAAEGDVSLLADVTMSEA